MPTLAQQVVLKEGGVFVVSHENGDISGNEGLGLYYKDMRYLSLFTLQLNGQAPPLLNFSGYRNFMGTFQHANPIMHLPGEVVLLPETLSIRRSRFIHDGLHERIEIVNYNRFPVPITLSLAFGSDFRDLFDVRGFQRDKWGELLPPTFEDGRLLLRYMGLDGLARSTEATFDRLPDSVDIVMPRSDSPTIEPGIMVPVVGAPSYHITIEPAVATLTWNFNLEPHTPMSLSFHVMPRSGSVEAQPRQTAGSTGRFDPDVERMRASYQDWDTQSTEFWTDNQDFNRLLKRSKYDLRVLSEPVGDGYFPSAGIPWYACPFGRDSLITALQTLSLNPSLGVGTLRMLARYQGTREDAWREEQPGKILHEYRNGEMARLGLVPHSPYYGSVDATPLFVMLFVETMGWLDDDLLYRELLPNVLRAVEWIDRYGDVDGDGLVEYVAAATKEGIRNQIWKDSRDSTQFPDGTFAETPVAAVEVQGYVYAARLGLSRLLRRKGDEEAADRLAYEAEALKERFNSAFWMPESGYFAQALDKDKRPVPTITSNPGHALWCGIADEEKARLTAQRIVQPDMVSGWGLRTISDESPSYNPMSYHNGSIWPHDNSIIVAGLKRYGCHDEANKVITEIVDASQYFPYDRLPELYCGFRRDYAHASGPAEYPVSCSPQAWAAAAPILMLQTILGLQADAAQRRLSLCPRLPDWLNNVRLHNLRVGEQRISLQIDKQGDHAHVSLLNGDSSIALDIE
ncbi:MAG TPA: glycogen debranching N-terminal domain-containing protein [Chloroflexia bacterium]